MTQLLRLLRNDPHDEQAHLSLVRVLDDAGRYGDARRRYHAYVARMAELGVRPARFPGSSDRTLTA